MTEQPLPILEFDPAPNAILNPHGLRLDEPLPERVVLCFFLEVLRSLARRKILHKIGHAASEMGRNPIYRMDLQGVALAVMHPGVGAPLAAGFLEELIASGGKRFIACGGCGVLQKEIVTGHPVVLEAAVRDEGTSYHYLPASREVRAGSKATAALTETLDARGIGYILGKAWTTDGLYRETSARRALRRAEGCQVVEMEAAAFFAVAQFREVEFGQLVYGGDLVVPEGWDKRGWYKRKNDRRLMFELAAEALLKV
jgi:uridine phosphorylase